MYTHIQKYNLNLAYDHGHLKREAFSALYTHIHKVHIQVHTVCEAVGDRGDARDY